MKIPIKNLYYLLIYAWDVLEEADVVDVNADDHTRLVDLFADVLNHGINHLIRRGIDRNYVTVEESIAHIRGKLQISESVKRLDFLNARACCTFDELSHNLLHNQILKSTVQNLIRCDDLDPSCRRDLVSTYKRLPEVDDIRLTKATFERVQLHRNIRSYRFLLEVCRLIAVRLMVYESTGTVRFRDFVRDEKTMSSLFERFVRNFYKKHQDRYTVKSEELSWQDTTGSSEAMEFLPKLKTDTSLISDRHHIVIDTKYYTKALTEHYQKERVRSEHLYQLFAYMKNIESKSGHNVPVDGILLYPAVDSRLDLRYEIHGHRTSVRSLDLGQHWKLIHQDLLSLINCNDPIMVHTPI